MVFDGEIRHCVRMRFTLTRPYLGTASSRSKTLAVWRYSGGSSSRPWIFTRPALRSRLRRALRGRISFARFSASILWVKDRSGVRPADDVLAGDWEAAGMGGDTTQEAGLGEAEIAKKARISL